MTIPEDRPNYRTLRGFLSKAEPDEENYFRFSVTLRIFGDGVPFGEITRVLGVQPTYLRHKGDRRGPNSPPYRDDAWHYQPAVLETELLGVHLNALWAVVESRAEYLRSLKQRFRVDIFCGYRSNCDTAGFEIPHESLKVFAALEVPFGISIVIA